MRVATMLGEALRTASAQRVSSLLITVLCAAICAAPLLTVGRTAAAEEQLLSRLDSAGSRLLVVTDDRAAGLVTPAVIEVVDGLDTTERAVGVDGPVDVTNAAVGGGGVPVPTWTVAGDPADAVQLTRGRWPEPGEAIVSERAVQALGLEHPAGAVQDSNGREWAVVGSYRARPPFEQFDAGLVAAGDRESAVQSVQVVVASVEAARITETLVVATLAPADLGDVTVASPAALADLQLVLGGDLGEYGRGVLLLMVGGGGFLIAVVVLAEVLLRRRDLGRRRALGASRGALLGLVVCRTVAAAVPGAILGTAAGLLAAAAWAERPPVEFAIGVGLGTSLVVAIAAVAPALVAATRDPVGVLRTP